MDRLTGLEVFVRVVDSAGFSAAARRLNLSATMVSNHIQALEERLGARLLNRTTRRISLTEVGRAYYERCVQILGELEAADRAAGELQSTPRGMLRLHTNAHIVRFLAPVVVKFLAAYPEASIEHNTGERMIDLVDEGVDLAIRTLPPPDSSLIVRRLAPWRHIACCSPEYLERHDAPERPEDLQQHNCLRYSFYPFGDEWRFLGPGGESVSVRVRSNLLTSSGEQLRLAALSATGVFLAPSFAIVEDLAEGRLVRLLPDFHGPEFAITAIYPHRHHLSAKVRSFVDIAAAHFAEQRGYLDAGVAAPDAEWDGQPKA
jgi:DNA-binding transcriptional LysR family regulator